MIDAAGKQIHTSPPNDALGDADRSSCYPAYLDSVVASPLPCTDNCANSLTFRTGQNHGVSLDDFLVGFKKLVTNTHLPESIQAGLKLKQAMQGYQAQNKPLIDYVALMALYVQQEVDRFCQKFVDTFAPGFVRGASLVGQLRIHVHTSD